MADTILRFGDVLEAADRLSESEQENLIDVLRKRLVERRRQEIVEDVMESRRELESGKVRVVTPDELMDELLS
jgi:hypothetical protein